MTPTNENRDCRQQLEASLGATLPLTRNPATGRPWTRSEWNAAMEAVRREALTMKGTGDFDPNEETGRDPWTGLYRV